MFFIPGRELHQFVDHRLLSNTFILPCVFSEIFIQSGTSTADGFSFLKYSAEEAALIIVVRVEAQASSQIQRVGLLEHFIVHIGVSVVEHSRLAERPFPVRHGLVSQMPCGALTSSLSSVENFPFGKTRSVFQFWANFFRHVN